MPFNQFQILVNLAGGLAEELQDFPVFEILARQRIHRNCRPAATSCRQRLRFVTVFSVVDPFHQVADHWPRRPAERSGPGVDSHAALVDHPAWDAHNGAVALHVAHHHGASADSRVGPDRDGSQNRACSHHHVFARVGWRLPCSLPCPPE